MFDNVYSGLKVLDDFLQRDVSFNIEHKTVRKGRLLLYNINDYYVKFTILTNKNVHKNYEIPYPYMISSNDTHVDFSYKIHDLCRGNYPKEQIARQFEPVANKLYDKNMRIIITPQ